MVGRAQDDTEAYSHCVCSQAVACDKQQRNSAAPKGGSWEDINVTSDQATI